jgi:predicted dehydrogenase
LVQRILNAGKHVMTTKPFELDVAEAEQACETARRSGLALHMNSPAPTPAGDMDAIRRWVAEEKLGRPICLQAMTWSNYHEQADGSWMDDPLRCPAAPLFRLGVYFLGEFAGLLGRPVKMSVQQSRIRTGRPTADTAQMNLAYENGALANIFSSFCVGDGRPWSDEVTIGYEHGRIHRWMERTGELDMSRDRAVVELHRPGKPKMRVETAAGDFTGWYNWNAFQAAVRDLPGSVRLDADSLVMSVRLLSALTRASQSGAVESI